MKYNKKIQGVTILEMLAVVVIVGIMATFLVYNFSTSREQANRLEVLTFEEDLTGRNVDTLVSEWGFNGFTDLGNFATNEDVLDSWGYNNGEVDSHQPTVKGGENCVKNKCLEFDGLNDYVFVENNGTLNFNNGMTISLWFKNTGMGASDSSVILGNGNNESYRLLYVSSTNLVRWTVTCDGGNYSIGSANAVPEDEWHNVVVSYNNSGIISMYIDGKFSDSLNNIPLNLQATVNGLGIGSSGVGSQNFKGLIDEVKIYKKALTIAEVQEKYLVAVDKFNK